MITRWKRDALPGKGDRGQGVGLLAGVARSNTGWAMAVLAACGTGCLPAATNTVQLLDCRDPAEPVRYRETFPVAYYDLDDHGNLHLVLQKTDERQPGPEHAIEQVIWVQSVWRPRPGRTVADATQINGQVFYQVRTADGVFRWRGAGSVFFDEAGSGKALNGVVDQAVLAAVAEGDAEAAGGRLEMSARFAATRDPRRVWRVVNDLGRWFAPSKASGLR
ncbi:MAG TPA: hypothetical protein PKK06_04985 [Phycisphaerae bacterium]|nr:hypothetical protein [Phycisphaerae bacterium]HNU45195.1 hypothetical protein [Phycisphaerae bacterium]